MLEYDKRTITILIVCAIAVWWVGMASSHVIYNSESEELKVAQVDCYNQKGIPFIKDKTVFFCAKDFLFIRKLDSKKEPESIE